MQRRLIMLRHGQTVYNATRRMQGHLDTQLSETGIAQARAAASMVAQLGVSKIVASDLSRAADTAEIIADAVGVACDYGPAPAGDPLGGVAGQVARGSRRSSPGGACALAQRRDMGTPGR